MKKKIIIIISILLLLIFLLGWFLSKIQIMNGMMDVSDRISTAKAHNVFVKQYNIKDSTILLKNNIKVIIREAWIEKMHFFGFWRDTRNINEDLYNIVLRIESPQQKEYMNSWIFRAIYNNDSSYVGRATDVFFISCGKSGNFYDSIILKALEHRTPDNLKRELGSIVLTSSK